MRENSCYLSKFINTFFILSSIAKILNTDSLYYVTQIIAHNAHTVFSHSTIIIITVRTANTDYYYSIGDIENIIENKTII